jgi:hypothetical protein
MSNQTQTTITINDRTRSVLEFLAQAAFTSQPKTATMLRSKIAAKHAAIMSRDILQHLFQSHLSDSMAVFDTAANTESSPKFEDWCVGVVELFKDVISEELLAPYMRSENEPDKGRVSAAGGDDTWDDTQPVPRKTTSTDPFDEGILGLKEALGALGVHKHGSSYKDKCYACIKEALPLASLIRSDEQAAKRLSNLAEEQNVKIRSHANNRDILTVLVIASKKQGRPTSAAERNRWATIVDYGQKKGHSPADLVGLVERLGGINKTATAWAKLLPQPEPEDVPLVRVTFTAFDAVLDGEIPAVLAESIAKRIRAALSVEG